MRLSIGSTAVSASGGNAELIGQIGVGWLPISAGRMTVDEAVALLDGPGHDTEYVDPLLQGAVLSSDEGAPRFTPGDEILWRYSRHVEMARVIRDDDRGLVIWMPSGSARLESVPADGRRPREVPMHERFSVAWKMMEARWTGPGVVRVAPAGRPWSVWFFRRPDGSPDGAYVNLELPHRRVAGESAGIFSRDLVLDIWIDAEHPGAEDVWLKDADELEAAVAQGRFTDEQAEAVRVLADHAAAEFIATGGWPLDEHWDEWMPDSTLDQPVMLPDGASIETARRRSGRSSLEG